MIGWCWLGTQILLSAGCAECVLKFQTDVVLYTLWPKQRRLGPDHETTLFRSWSVQNDVEVTSMLMLIRITLHIPALQMIWTRWLVWAVGASCHFQIHWSHKHVDADSKKTHTLCELSKTIDRIGKLIELFRFFIQLVLFRFLKPKNY